ncbi:hypothetical protein ASAP_1966 [Asaia bogorensis]|uniref:Uncharacterized protein n=1 Tax=Asaia bogorensis TaxID=91915 RepID=A0A060QKL5_9PROT|nr:hypothetical protein ASAP_1966 [Asaia bogorensis]
MLEKNSHGRSRDIAFLQRFDRQYRVISSWLPDYRDEETSCVNGRPCEMFRTSAGKFPDRC